MTALAPSPGVDALGPAALRLHARFAGAVDLETVRHVLDESYEALLARATVTSYLLILAERTAAIRLAAMTAGRVGGRDPGSPGRARAQSLPARKATTSRAGGNEPVTPEAT